MYNNIGTKVKGLAVLLFMFDVLGCLIGSIALWSTEEDLLVWIGFAVLIGGIFLSLVCSWVLYCIG